MRRRSFWFFALVAVGLIIWDQTRAKMWTREVTFVVPADVSSIDVVVVSGTEEVGAFHASAQSPRAVTVRAPTKTVELQITLQGAGRSRTLRQSLTLDGDPIRIVAEDNW